METKATTVHPWEHVGALETLDAVKQQNAKLRKYATYLACRMQKQAMVINDKVTHIAQLPVVAASMLDDLDDAVTVSGLGADPRTWPVE